MLIFVKTYLHLNAKAEGKDRILVFKASFSVAVQVYLIAFQQASVVYRETDCVDNRR